MARSIEINLMGTGATITAIGKYDMETREEIKKVVKTTSKNVQKKAKSLAPVGPTGNLKKSIRPKYFDNGLSSTVVPRGKKGAHRHFIEYGTQSRYQKTRTNKKTGVKKKYSPPKYVGSMPAMPFMTPAEQSQEAVYEAKIRSVVERDEVI